MKDEILKREMFSKPMSKSSRNSGIMAGFEDEMEDEGTQPMARSPQNPEILMNNLRGDIRSVDARYLELAQMVGEEAAMETPPEVLAMLQSQLAAQAAPPMPQGGIGSLPQGTEMAPPPMMGQGQAMPPGMEGMPPFPQGGAEQAPPTPDGMPPLRAADGVFVTQGARQSGSENIYDLYDPLYMPPRFDDLTSGRIPEDQMTDKEKRFLKTYKFGMGFTGGSIRDVASQGMGRITSALSPYIQRGINYLDELVTPFTRPTMRVEPMAEGGRRAVIQGRENIVQGARGPEFSTGTRLQGANTLDFGRIPFTQAFRESGLGNFIANYPKSTLGGTTAAASTLYALSGDKNPPTRSAADLANVNKLINEIPGQGPPLRDAKGNRIAPFGRENEPFEVNFRDDRIVPPTPERPENATINRINQQGDVVVPFETPFNRPEVPIITPKRGEVAPTDTATTTKDFIDNKVQVFKTRGERIKAEYASLAPTFKELLGDTKADARTNALLLLADAGFKFASTYKPTMAMALGDALSGVPRGFASIVAQAKDRDIRIKTGALQQATENVNLQDKVARDLQLKQLEIEGRLANSLLQARSREQLENIKQRNTKEIETLRIDRDLLVKEIEFGGTIEEDAGMGLTVAKKKNGSFLGSYIKPGPDGKLPAVVQQAIDSGYTLRQTDNPFVDNLGPAPTTTEDQKAGRVKLGETLRSLDNGLKAIDNMRGLYVGAYSPGTWVQDKINNVIVPVSLGAVRPDVKQDAVVGQIKMTMNGLMKQIASANDSGRVAVQEQEWVREMTDALNNPTAFFGNKDRAAKLFAVIETQLRNSRQQVLTQLGFEKNDLTMKVPQTGTQSDPFMYPSTPEDRQRMDIYLKSIFRGADPKGIVYINADGVTARTTVEKILSAK